MDMNIMDGNGTTDLDSDMFSASMTQLFGAMMGMTLGGSNAALCTEGDWAEHPAGLLFRATRGRDVVALEALVGRAEHRERVDALDGDGCGMLHTLAIRPPGTEAEARALVNAIERAGGDLNLRAGGMMAGETPLHAAAW